MQNANARMLNSKLVANPNGSEREGPRTLRFGLFDLDLRAGELRRKGARVKLQEQPFQILAHLLEKPGEVVTREELRQRLWPADTFVDFDHSLNAAIRRLRDALGDSAENPTFVETVARRGYRFLAPVTALPANGNGTVLMPVAVTASRSSKAFPRGWLFAAAGGVIVLVFLAFRFGILLGHIFPSAPARVLQLTPNPADDRVRSGGHCARWEISRVLR